MTVINTMRLADNRGGMVADSQSSTQIRKYDLADKLYVHKSPDFQIFGGGAGVSDLLYDAHEQVSSRLSQVSHPHFQSVAQLYADILIAMKRSRIDTYLRSTFGISPEQALSGQGIAQHLLQPISEALTVSTPQAREFFANEFLLLGKDASGVHIYHVPMGSNPMRISRPYASIGSGSDESDKILVTYVRGLKREDRSKIPFLEGMAVLIRATNAAKDINQGVGGVPMIGYFTTDNHVVLLEENACNLATELVRAHDAGFLDTPLLSSSLEQLLESKVDHRLVEEQAFLCHPRAKDLMRFLRGYK